MNWTCSRCAKVLTFEGEHPSFCAYCGAPLRDQPLSAAKPISPPRVIGADSADTDLLSETVNNNKQLDETVDEPIRARSGDRLRSSGWDPVVGGLALDDGPRTADGSSGSQIVGDYRIYRLLGKGGMGVVYEAEELAGAGQRKVALKFISADWNPSPEDVARFRREGRLASTLEHPNCVFVFAVGDYQGFPYIVMELMTGDTLRELVQRTGPLAQGDAVRKILEVIEGLIEAHRLGVIHRDVKPSNCFLTPNGHVKIGDFGLARMLAGDAQLTGSGAFIGTPLYASPEQVRKYPLDIRTDVYSVAATLYFLLTGRAPFEDDSARPDAAAVLARIVTERAPPPRMYRPDLSRILDRIIRKGLEPSRDKRFRDLKEFRQALWRFIPGKMPAARWIPRFGAFAFDMFLIGLLQLLILPATENGLFPELNFREISSRHAILDDAIFAILFLAYFTITESLWGASPGKFLAKLRVFGNSVGDSPSRIWTFLRAFFLYVLVFAPADTLSYWFRDSNEGPEIFLGFAVSVFLSCMIFGFGWRRPERRGWHEYLSRTRTVRYSLVQPSWQAARGLRKRNWESGFDRIQQPTHLPEVVGAYLVRGALTWNDQSGVLSCMDSGLHREVWVVVHAAPASPTTDGASPSAPVTRTRDLGRPARLRWLTSGSIAGQGRWDAFLAPKGAALSQLVQQGGGLPWRDVRGIMVQLVEELRKSASDGSLPTQLSADQVYIQPDGNIQLADILQTAQESPLSSEHDRCLAFLDETAHMALDGMIVRDRPVRTPIPVHAARFLQGLLPNPVTDRRRPPYESLQDIADALHATEDKSVELTWFQRGMDIAVFLGLQLGMQLLILYLFFEQHWSWSPALAVVPILLETLTGGGWLCRFFGAYRVGAYNRNLSGRRGFLRGLLLWCWFPLGIYLLVITREHTYGTMPRWFPILNFLFLPGIPLIFALHAVTSPGRMLHDRLIGGQLVND